MRSQWKWHWWLLPLVFVLPGQEGCQTDEDGDGYTAADGDCDDTNATVYPGAPELCDGIDNDCDGNVEAISCWGFSQWGSSFW